MRRLATPLLLACALAALPARADEVSAELKARMQNLEQSLDDWDLEGAKRELAELRKVAPDVEPLAYWEGRIAFEEGRYDEAVQLLEKAGVGDKPGGYVRLAKDTRDITRDHLRAESAHFILSYPKGKDEVLVPYALETLEAVRAALLQDLGYAPPGKVRVEVVRGSAELAKMSTLTREAIRTTGTIAICKFNKLMVTSPKAVIRGYDWRDTLAHEYVHLVVSQKSLNTVPIWMHEGLAKYLESRWRGAAGGAMTPSTLALLGSRLRANTLVPFEKMHPSMALLPTAEDAATAFAEVFFAMDLLHKDGGAKAFRALVDARRAGKSDQKAVEEAWGRSWPQFEKAWQAHMRKQPFPRELIPRTSSERHELAENAPGKAKDAEKKKKRDISFGDFVEVEEPDARRSAHLGELLRERGRVKAAAEQYGRAHARVGSRYESVSNKYALSLMELKRFDEAQRVLESSLATHPGSAQTSVHLGRLALRKRDWALARRSYQDALDVDPMDPEVHVALARACGQLQDAACAERAGKAAALLLEVDAQRVAALGRALGSEDDLLDPLGVAAPEPAPAPPPPPRDAGPSAEQVLPKLRVRVTHDAGP